MNTTEKTTMLYALETCFKEGINGASLPGLNDNQWQRMMLAPANMDTTLVRLQYYRKNWGTSRCYRLARVK